MMKICEAKYYTYYNLTEYHSTLFYMLHNEIRLQTFQEQSKVCRKSILKQAKKNPLDINFQRWYPSKGICDTEWSGRAFHFNH